MTSARVQSCFPTVRPIPATTRVVVVERYAALRKAIVARLDNDTRVSVVADAGSPEEAIVTTWESHPDLVVIGASMLADDDTWANDLADDLRAVVPTAAIALLTGDPERIDHLQDRHPYARVLVKELAIDDLCEGLTHPLVLAPAVG